MSCDVTLASDGEAVRDVMLYFRIFVFVQLNKLHSHMKKRVNKIKKNDGMSART